MLSHLTIKLSQQVKNNYEPLPEETLDVSRLPRTLTHLTLKASCQLPVVGQCLPNSITHLSLEGCTSKVLPFSLPSSLRWIRFGNDWNQQIEEGMLPKNLTDIIFDSVPSDTLPNFLHSVSFGKLQITCFPPSLTRIKFGAHFNQPVDNLPNQLTHIQFGVKFNQPVDRLPNRLTHLTFGFEFNQPVDNLPRSLINIVLGVLFNHPVEHLPHSLQSLSTTGCFTQSIRLLPKSLTYLTLDSYMTRHCWALPPFLQHLMVSVLLPNISLPASLTSLECTPEKIETISWPTGLMHLKLGQNFEGTLENLPSSLTHLTLPMYFDEPLLSLPICNSLTHITFDKFGTFNGQFDGHLFPHLTHLTFGAVFNQPINNLPKILTHLCFYKGSKFNNPIDRLPPHLTHLVLGEAFNRPCNRLPTTLTHLTFGLEFNQPILDLPPSLLVLAFSDIGNFNQSINHLPQSLKFVLQHLRSRKPKYHSMTKETLAQFLAKRKEKIEAKVSNRVRIL